MARQEFRNQFNKLMGWRQKQGDHDVGYDYLGRIKGYYEPRCDVTKDVFGQVVSRGDTLSSLIFTRQHYITSYALGKILLLFGEFIY